MRRTILAIGIAAVSIAGLAACGDDATGSSVSVDGTTAGDNDSSNGEMSKECLDFAMAWASAIGATSGSGPGAEGDWASSIASMQDAVPAELKDSVAVWSSAMNDYLTILTEHPDDVMAPEVVAALEQVNTPEVQAASDAISAYFDNGCKV